MKAAWAISPSMARRAINVTWRLAKMNLAVRGIDADIRWNSEGSFHKDELPDLRADYILANPPFNISDWGGERLREDPRWKYGIPPAGNANFGWLQHILHHLGANGTAGVVLANGSMSSSQSGEGDIRKAMIKGRRGRLHDRPAGAVVLFHPDPRVPVVPGKEQKERSFSATGRARFCSSMRASWAS